MWWIYFDVVALVAARRLTRAPVGREQNAMARDSYSYIHFVMVAGIVLVALGLKKTLGDVDHPLKIESAFALLGGLAFYLLGHVAFRLRNIHTLNRQRLVVAAIFFALIPLALEISALAILAVVNVLIWGLIGYETTRYGEARARIRRELAGEPAPATGET
jgi:low temperature requirement protein LtrA